MVLPVRMSSFFLLLPLLAQIAIPVHAGDLQAFNNCPFDIWVGMSSGSKDRLGRGQSITKQSNNGVLFALTGCDGGGNNCDLNERGKISLFEFNWDANGRSWYDISAVDGYNIKITADPFNKNEGGSRCQTLSCGWEFWNNCPEDLKLYRGSKVTTCQSPCRRYGAPCGREAQNNEYTRRIKASCGNSIYTYPSDDLGTYNCERNNNGFKITFC